MLNNKKANVLEKKCRGCGKYVRAGSRKCNYCGFIFKSKSQYFVDSIKDVFGVKRRYLVERQMDFADFQGFFTLPEIERLINSNNINILMYMTLDSVSLLDELALLEVGELIISMNKQNAILENNRLKF